MRSLAVAAMYLRAASRVTRVPGHRFDFRPNRAIQRAVPVDELVAVRVPVLCLLCCAFCAVPFARCLRLDQSADA